MRFLEWVRTFLHGDGKKLSYLAVTLSMSVSVCLPVRRHCLCSFMADVPAPGCDTPPREIAVIGPCGGVYSASETHPNKEVVSCGPEPAKNRDGCHRRRGKKKF